MIRVLIHILMVMLLFGANAFYTKHKIAGSIKTVNINTIIDEYKSTLYRAFESGEVNEADLAILTAEFLSTLETSLKNEEGIVLISQSVLSGGKDVTQKIKDYLNR